MLFLGGFAHVIFWYEKTRNNCANVQKIQFDIIVYWEIIHLPHGYMILVFKIVENF